MREAPARAGSSSLNTEAPWITLHRRASLISVEILSNQTGPALFHSMKSETMHGYRFTEDRQMRTILQCYIPFYNRSRVHSSLDYVSPATYEKQLA